MAFGAAAIAVALVVRRQWRWGRVRRALIEVNIDATRLLVADVNTLKSVLLREVYSREVASEKGSLEAVVRSLFNEAVDVGASQLAVVVRNALALRPPQATAWTASDEARAAWRCARARGLDQGAVVGCVRTTAEGTRAECCWESSRRESAPVWTVCAADAAGQRTFATRLGEDGKLVDKPPAWLLQTSFATVVGDEVGLARCLDALHGQVHVQADSLRKKLAATYVRRHQTASVAAAQLELLIALSQAADITHFTYLRSFGLCLGALLHNDLFLHS